MYGSIDDDGPEELAIDYMATRAEMLHQGVPDSYIDALLDDGYMQRLVLATEALNEKRNRRLNRYLLLNKLVLGFLLAQALLGVLIAFFKLVQPDKVYTVRPLVESVDLVLMLDASRHMRDRREDQHSAALEFSSGLQKAMRSRLQSVQRDAWGKIDEERKQQQGFRIPILSRLTARSRDRVHVRGGIVRVRTGAFNAARNVLLHEFTSDLAYQEEMLAAFEPEDYRKGALLMGALLSCEASAKESAKGTRRFCAVMGDNEAMCQERLSPEIDSLCEEWDLCPEERDQAGNMLEYMREFTDCSKFVQDTLEPEHQMSVIMMSTSGSEKESQLRFRSSGYRAFVRNATGCHIRESSDRVKTEDGQPHYSLTTGCERFVVARDLSDLRQKSRNLAELLKADFPVSNFQLKHRNDWRWYLFLLLPLNLIVYAASAKLLKLYMQVRARLLGENMKRMIKVTKIFVEKETPSDTDMPHVGFREVELADMVSRRPMVFFGSPLTLRARLKGGCLRANVDSNVVDGNGHPAAVESYWHLEPADAPEGEAPTDTAVQAGQRVRLKNGVGRYMTAEEAGTGLRRPSGVNGPDPLAEFEVELAEDDEREDSILRLGDVVRLRCVATGNVLAVEKDGTCNATGQEVDLETQLVIDRGGEAVFSGDVVHLRAGVSGEVVRATADGTALALQGHGSWHYWHIERLPDGTPDGGTGSPSGHSVDETPPKVAPLKHGEVITLRGINEKLLEVGAGGLCSCGALDDAAALAHSFVVERASMGRLRKYDTIIRHGGEIWLRPLYGNVSRRDLPTLRVSEQGSVIADGGGSGPADIFHVEVTRLKLMAAPLDRSMALGDVGLTLTSLWDKSASKRLSALAASWTTAEGLRLLAGADVAVKGQASACKAATWIAVVGDDVDVQAAARDYASKGAVGVVVRCQGKVPLKKLAVDDGQGLPTIPLLFVQHESGVHFEDRGVTVTDAEFRAKYLTGAMRALAQAGDEKSVALGHFVDVSRALLELKNEPEKSLQMEAAPSDVNGKYKWKVTSNTHYIWGAKGHMQVNFGSKLPPAAMSRRRMTGELLRQTFARRGADASKSNDLSSQSVICVAMIEADDLIGRRLSTTLEVAAREKVQREVLPEESDFKIEYTFEEVEIPKDEALAEDLVDAELIDAEGTVVSSLTVPYKQFWKVVIYLIFSTLLLVGFLFWVLFSGSADQDHFDEDATTTALAASASSGLGDLAFGARLRAASFL